ncbi:hypothetical protein EXY23_26775, partial [Roseicella aquatilis]
MRPAHRLAAGLLVLLLLPGPVVAQGVAPPRPAVPVAGPTAPVAGGPAARSVPDRTSRRSSERQAAAAPGGKAGPAATVGSLPPRQARASTPPKPPRARDAAAGAAARRRDRADRPQGLQARRREAALQ